MVNRGLTSLLGVNYPVIQAPMAGGPTTTELVAAVSNAGGLGMIGAGYLKPDQIREQIREIKQLTGQPFGVNLFVPTPYKNDETVLEKARHWLEPFKELLKVQVDDLQIPNYQHDLAIFAQQIEVIMEERISVCSFTFGIPSANILSSLKQNSIFTIGTATTVTEATLIEAAGFDAVVLQGSEAGGHRGTFLKGESESLIGLMSLIPQAADQIHIPIIAAGGIMDGRGLIAAQSLGAQAVQMGTAFLVCEESGASQEYKLAILEAGDDQTELTKAFSGKLARGIRNKLITGMKAVEYQLPPYPVQNELTKGIRKEAARQKNREYMSLWSGQSPRLSNHQSVQELMVKIIREAAQTKALLFKQQ
ncbi:NAD(P)H-dependent flavin oxidoreductase [Neobacillus sp. SM06]|uniref:NAD(P)H-dependent flavin oxidoreductase n=1 Tax=Neobacillus sp. SM06 TaxID=3422492 RepID=UPI003D273D8C